MAMVTTAPHTPCANSAGNAGVPACRRKKEGFTLAEVLAALAFMAIVIPVAVEGIRVATLAGQTGERRAAAMRIAERVLNEWIVTGQLNQAASSGAIVEGAREYRWSLRLEPWVEDAMRLATVEVAYPLRGKDSVVRLATVVDN
jgi:type II secretory pathway pseudopilin PulG